jgi:hypothetical protein
MSFWSRCGATLVLAMATLLTGATSHAQYGDVSPPPDELQVGFDTITADQAQQWLHLLAGPNSKAAARGRSAT